MNLGCTLSTVAGRAVLVVRGDLDLATMPKLRDELSRAVQRHAGQPVYVDLDQVGSTDDLALGVLLSAAAMARRHNGQLIVVCANPAQRARLAELRLDQIIEVRHSLTAD